MVINRIKSLFLTEIDDRALGQRYTRNVLIGCVKMLSDAEFFSSNQVVCIEQGELLLFAEVVQMVPERARCWARPLAIAQMMPNSLSLGLLHDLRESAHLLLPAVVFRAALDVEVMPLMTALYHPEKTEPGENAPLESATRESATRSVTELETRQALHRFIQGVNFHV